MPKWLERMDDLEREAIWKDAARRVTVRRKHPMVVPMWNADGSSEYRTITLSETVTLVFRGSQGMSRPQGWYPVLPGPRYR